MKLTIVIPVYNERELAPQALARVEAAPLPEGVEREIVLIDDCSTDLDLRGAPVFRHLVGPIPEGKTVVRYETPEVFEVLTREWSMPRPKRSRRSRSRTS